MFPRASNVRRQKKRAKKQKKKTRWTWGRRAGVTLLAADRRQESRAEFPTTWPTKYEERIYWQPGSLYRGYVVAVTRVDTNETNNKKEINTTGAGQQVRLL